MARTDPSPSTDARPTLQDIAHLVGVTPATVSNVLAGKHKGRRADAIERADHIRRVARSLGYRVSHAARATRTGRTGLIGVLRSPQPQHSVHVPEFEVGLEHAAHHAGLCLVHDILEPDAARPPRVVRESLVDGLVVNFAFGTPAPVKDVIDRWQVPTVWVNRDRPTDCVRPDDHGAAIEATRHLLRHGHRRVTFLTVDQDPQAHDIEPHYSGLARYDGYRAAIRDAGLTPQLQRLSVRADGVPEHAGAMLAAFEQWLARPDRPTAILCSDGGRVLLAAAWKLGLQVPRDLSVVTFDNEAAAGSRIAIDRMLVRYRSLGRAAVEALTQRLDDPDASHDPRPARLIPFEFHQVGTVAGPSPPA